MTNEEIKITKVEFIRVEAPKVKARVDITFGLIEVKGFKLIKGDNNKEYLTPPSYFVNGRYKSLFWTDKENWTEIQKVVLKKYDEFLINETMGNIDDYKNANNSMLDDK